MCYMVTYKAGLRFHFIESCHHDHVEHCQWVRLGSWRSICDGKFSISSSQIYLLIVLVKIDTPLCS